MTEEKIERLKEAFMDLLNQHCGKWETIYPEGWKPGIPYEHKFMGYDSMYLSANQNALDLAVELELIKKEDISR